MNSTPTNNRPPRPTAPLVIGDGSSWPGRAPHLTLSHQIAVSPMLAKTEPQATYFLLNIGVSAAVDEQMPLNICLVLDHSLSMRGDKLSYVFEASEYVIRHLTPRDVLSIVSFNDRASLVSEPRLLDNPGEIAATLATVVPRGGTEMAVGMQMGLSQLHDGIRISGPALSSMLLLTDGRTYGDEPVCEGLAEYARKQGFLITALGVGDEWNEDLLEKLASRCGSRSEYISSPQAIVGAFRAFVERLRGIVGYNARIALRCPEGTKVMSLHRVQPVVGAVDSLLAAENDEQVYDLGALVGGEEQKLLLEVIVPPLAPGEHRLLDLTISYQQATPGRSRVRLGHEIGMLVVPAVTSASMQLAPDVKAAVEKVLAYRLQQKAWKDLAAGNVNAATQKLRMVATRLFESGADDLARQVTAEADYLEANGRTSSIGPKQIKYGTRGLGGTSGLSDA